MNDIVYNCDDFNITLAYNGDTIISFLAMYKNDTTYLSFKVEAIIASLSQYKIYFRKPMTFHIEYRGLYGTGGEPIYINRLLYLEQMGCRFYLPDAKITELKTNSPIAAKQLIFWGL